MPKMKLAGKSVRLISLLSWSAGVAGTTAEADAEAIWRETKSEVERNEDSDGEVAEGSGPGAIYLGSLPYKDVVSE